MYQDFSRQIQDLVKRIRANRKLSTIEQSELIIQRTIRIAAIYPIKQDAPEIAAFLQKLLEIDFFAQRLQVPQLSKMLKLVLGLQGTSDKFIAHDYLLVEDFDAILPFVLSSMAWYFWEKVSDDLAFIEDDLGTSFPFAQTLVDYNMISIAVIDAEMSIDNAVEKIKQMPEFNARETDVSKILNNTIGRKDFLGTILRSFFRAKSPAENEILTAGSQQFIDDPNKAFSIANLRSLSIAMEALKQSYTQLPSNLAWLYAGAIDGAKRRYTSMNAILSYPNMPIEDAIHLGWQSILLPYSFYSIIQFFATILPSVQKLLLEEAMPMTLSELVKDGSILGRLGNDAITSIIYFDEAQTLMAEMMGQTSLSGKMPRAIMAESNQHVIRMLIKDSKEKEYSTILSSGMYDNMSAQELWIQLMNNHRVVYDSFYQAELAFAAALQELIEKGLSTTEDNEESQTLRSAGTLIASSLLHFMFWMLDNLYAKGHDFDRLETDINSPSWLKSIKRLASKSFNRS